MWFQKFILGEGLLYRLKYYWKNFDFEFIEHALGSFSFFTDSFLSMILK